MVGYLLAGAVFLLVSYSLSYLSTLLQQEFYLSLRRQYQAGDSTPITTRQLESLIRLTEVNSIVYIEAFLCVTKARAHISMYLFA
jgi:hypothetical protein